MIRNPRTHGLPPRLPGSIVILAIAADIICLCQYDTSRIGVPPLGGSPPGSRRFCSMDDGTYSRISSSCGQTSLAAQTKIDHTLRLPCKPLKTKPNAQNLAPSAITVVLLSSQHMSLPASEPSTLSALTARQAKVALALAQGATITAAAAAAGLNRATIHRWLHAPDFAEAVRQASAAYILALSDESKNRRARALAAVDSLLTDPRSPTDERLRLALAILERPLAPLDGPGHARFRARQPAPRASSHPGKCNEMQRGVTGCNAKTSS